MLWFVGAVFCLMCVAAGLSQRKKDRLAGTEKEDTSGVIAMFAVACAFCLMMGGCSAHQDEVDRYIAQFPAIRQSRTVFESTHKPVKTWEGDLHGNTCKFAVYDGNIGVAYLNDYVVAIAAYEYIPSTSVPHDMTDFKISESATHTTTKYNNGVTYRESHDRKDINVMYSDRDASIWLMTGMKREEPEK